MSTTNDRRDKTRPRLPKDAEEDSTITPVSAAAPMTDEKLAAAQDPDADLKGVEGGVPVFAIAHRTVVVQEHEQEREHEALLVLYATRDGERVCERRFAAPAGSFGAVERAFIAPADALAPIREKAQRFAPVVQRHPEVA